jgi:hypothetical protein
MIDPNNPVIFPPMPGDGDPTGIKTMLAPSLLISGVAFWAIVVGTPTLLSDVWFRWVLSAYFIFWGIAYYLTSETAGRFYIGVVEVAGGVWSIWYQLGQFAVPDLHATPSDRLIFIAGSIALLANGVKDAAKGMEKRKKRRDTLPPKTATR